MTTGVVTRLVVGSRPPSRPLELVLEFDAAGASESVVAGEVRMANNDAAAASAASRAIVARLR